MKFHDPRQNCPPPSSHVIQLTGTIFQLNSRIKEKNVLSKFHENWAKNVTTVLLEKCAASGGHVFSPIPTIFKLVGDNNKNNVLTNFHDDWAKIATSRPNRENCHYIHIEKNAPPTGSHVFFTDLDHFRTRPRHQLNQLFTRKTAPPTGGHVFQRIGPTFELNQYIIKTNILTNLELCRDFIGTKLLTKFHEDGTRNVASRRRTDIRRTKTGHKSSPEQSVHFLSFTTDQQTDQQTGQKQFVTILNILTIKIQP
ncbi:hypothetical protein DPMN_011760 [Dreissena polymorpha]|uniref:Uncharacterized protein n=1 Tax=Dreissena polymorpha TaxID=45954 RepID=A0A9D4N4M8_DREPO|nr:hypothetical protein DPMN_011760 [Dreissena polymorpha]